MAVLACNCEEVSNDAVHQSLKSACELDQQIGGAADAVRALLKK